MIRGSTYSAVMHLTVLTLILFGLPTLAFLLPKLEKHEKPVPVVIMSDHDAAELSKARKSSEQKDKNNKVNKDTESASKKSGVPSNKPQDKNPPQDTRGQNPNARVSQSSPEKTKPDQNAPLAAPKPPPTEKPHGAFSIVKDPNPYSESDSDKTTTRDPDPKREKPVPVKGTGNDMTQALTTVNAARAPSLQKVQAGGAVSSKTAQTGGQVTPVSLSERNNGVSGPTPSISSPSNEKEQTQTDPIAKRPAPRTSPLPQLDAKAQRQATPPSTPAQGTSSPLPTSDQGDVQVDRKGLAEGALPPNDAVTELMAELANKVPRLKNLRDQLEKPSPENPSPAMAQSAKRMEKRSEEGFAHAQFSLAEMYLTGDGLPRSDKKALEMLNRAAMSGYLPAQLTLGMLAAEGKAMERNLAEAHTWLAVAAEQGNKAAQEVLPKLEKLMSTRDTVEARKRSFQLHQVLVIIHGGDIKKLSKTELSERLRVAAALGDVESVYVLLAQGADADGADLDGRTALIEAAWRGYARIVKSLIDNGANLGATDNTKKNALMWAAINGHAQVITNLLAAGMPIDEQDNEGITALMRATWNSHFDAVKVLVNAGAKLNIRDKQGLTALDYAVKSGNTEIQQFLKSAPPHG